MESVEVVKATRAQPLDSVFVTCVDEPFLYYLPHFEILAVKLQRVLVERVLGEETVRFDAFLRSTTTKMNFPACVSVSDWLTIEVR